MPPKTSIINENAKKPAEAGVNSEENNGVTSRRLRAEDVSTRSDEFDDLQRLPSDFDSSGEESERARAADIVSTKFGPTRALGDNLTRPSGKLVTHAKPVNGNASPDSLVNRSSKRKTEDATIVGSGKTDIFNTLHIKRTKKSKTYGSSHNKPSSQATAPKSTPGLWYLCCQVVLACC